MGIVEIRRDGDDRFACLEAELLTGAVFQGLEDHGGDFLRAILLIAELDLHILAHLALDRFDGALGGDDPLIARRLADQEPTVLGKTDKGRQDGIVIFREDVRLPVANDGDFAVRSTQIDADDCVHMRSPVTMLADTIHGRPSSPKPIPRTRGRGLSLKL